ncbi:MAG: transporter substrate-binding domain-containing protein [Anaerolineae bacterium]
MQASAADPRLAISPEVIVSDPYVIVLPRKAPELQRQVGAALQTLQADGTLDALMAHWFGPTPTE